MSLDPDRASRPEPPAAAGPEAPTPTPAPTRAGAAVLVMALVCAGVWVYRNSLDGAGIFDDEINVTYALDHYRKDPAVWKLPRPRDLARLSFIWNHKVGGGRVRGFHQVNRLIHILAALALFGLARRTLTLPSLRGRFGRSADGIAFAVALVWAVHPLQTEAVAYMVQRIESLMALVYLLCLYCLARAATSRRPRWWLALAVGLFWVGVGTKEVIATAPPVMLLFDRTFLAGSWREVLRRRGWFYAALLVPLAVFAASMTPYVFPRRKTHIMGLGHPWLTPRVYAMNQSAVILHYLRLAFWPDKLCLDYCWPVRPFRELAPSLAALSALLAATAAALRYRPRVGFLAAAFFLILAPTSSVMPINDLAVEHRMYLPLACVVALAALAAYRVCERLAARAGWSERGAASLLVALAALAAAPLAARTVRRNEDYRTPLRMWRSVVEVSPYAYRGHYNLGVLMVDARRYDEALACFRRAFDAACLRGRQWDITETHFRDLETFLTATHRRGDLIPWLRDRCAAHPDVRFFHWYLGEEYRRAGDYAKAAEEFRAVTRAEPGMAAARMSRVVVLLAGGRPRDAVGELREGLRRDPDSLEFRNALAWVLAAHPDPAVRDGREALRLAEGVCFARKAGDARSWGTLAAAYAEVGRFDDAARAAARAVALCRDPAGPTTAEGGDLGLAREQLAHYRRGLPYRLDPRTSDPARPHDGPAKPAPPA